MKHAPNGWAVCYAGVGDVIIFSFWTGRCAVPYGANSLLLEPDAAHRASLRTDHT